VVEFTAWPKTLRLYRTIIVTEKIDGTNAGVHIRKLGDVASQGYRMRDLGDAYPPQADCVLVGSDVYQVTAQSRTRLIYPGKDTDNYGFAGWVRDNATRLVDLLGEGLHMGAYWGKGINRAYGLDARRFSLFNTDKYAKLCADVGGVIVAPVPLIYQGMFSDSEIKGALADLAYNGSWAAPGFMNAEGVCVWHSQTRSVFKVTLDNQDCSKWEAFE
jgi:hypothetical protein